MMFCEFWENSRKRRTRFQIIENILRAARNGIYKTQIMYEAGLSYTQLSGYLSFLMKVGLLKTIKKNDRVVYKITSKGIRYLKSYEKIRDLLRKDNKQGVASFQFAKGFA